MARVDRRIVANCTKFIKPLLPSTILEIGVWEGRTARWFLDELLYPAGCWVGIDPWELEAMSPHDFPRDNGGVARLANVEATARENLADYGGRATIIKGRSCDVLRLRPHPLLQPEMLDLVYIDGIHHALEVLSDAMLSWPLVRTGGVIIFDDYRRTHKTLHAGLVEGVDAFLAAAEGKYRVLFQVDSQLGIQKTSDIAFEHPDDVRIHPEA